MSSIAGVDTSAARGWTAIAIAAATVLVYAQVRTHDFVALDDDLYVFENPVVVGGLTPDNLHAAVFEPVRRAWFPLTWISYQVDVELHELSAPGVLLGNVMLHVASSVLLFFSLRRLTSSLVPSAFVAAVFALHPLHVESVAWASERKDALSGFFFMCTLLAYARACERPSFARHVAVAVCFGLGLLAKPMLVTLPFVLLLLDYWPLGRLGRPVRAALLGRAVLEKLPLLAMALGISIATLIVQQGAGLNSHLGLALRLSNAARSYVWYAWKTLWPSGLAIFYPHPLGDIGVVGALFAALLVLGATALALLAARKRPYLSVGWLWFVGMLVPVIGIVQVGLQAHADRYAYLPMIGLSVAVAWAAVDWVGDDAGRRVLAAVAGLVVCTALGITAARQVGYWRNDRTLFTRAAEVTDRNWLAHGELARVRLARGDVEGAERHYALSVEYARGPMRTPFRFQILYEYANLLALLGRGDEARPHYEEAIAMAEVFHEDAFVDVVRARLEGLR